MSELFCFRGAGARWVRSSLLGLLAVLAAACTSHRGPATSGLTPEQIANLPPGTKVTPEIAKAAEEATDSYQGITPASGKHKRPYRSSTDDSRLTAYKQKVAADIETAAKEYLHGGRPAEPLRAVIIFEFTVNADGAVKTRLVRAPRDEEMQRRALAILKQAEPFPKPPGGKTLTFTETLLFDWDGRFRVRTRLES
ncbi:MAG: energy transducer TonB [Burkholderiaceae bacterium]|jgi:TonB family protein